MKHADIKPGMWVKIIGNNENRPGGRILGYIGKVYKLKSFTESNWGYSNTDFNGEVIDGFWKMHQINWVWHPSQFIIIRDEKGRFIKREAALQENTKYWEVLRKKVRNSRIGVASFAVKFKDSAIRYLVDRPCSASLSYLGKESPIEICMSLDYKHITEDEWKEFLPYLGWLANESPLKDLFVVKDPEWMKEWGVRISTNYSKHLVYGLTVIIRRWFEYTTSRKTFHLLINNGASYNDCFWWMGLISVDNNQNVTFNTDGHNYLTGANCNFETLKRVYKTWFVNNNSLDSLFVDNQSGVFIYRQFQTTVAYNQLDKRLNLKLEELAIVKLSKIDIKALLTYFKENT